MSSVGSFRGFRLKLTRWGGLFLISMLVLGFAAVNTGNNSLMALFGLALASFAVSGIWSRQVLGGAEVRATAPKEIFAGRPTMVEVELRNGCRLFPAYGIVVRDRLGRAVVVEKLLAASAVSRHSIELRFPDRGWTDLGPWTLEVVMPLGFFVKSKVVLDRREVLVYPRLLPASAMTAEGRERGRYTENFDDRGREGEVVQLRTFREGDDTRQMHWKQTARQQQPIVTDRQRRAADPVFFVVDPRLSDVADPVLRDRFETMLSEVATGVVRRLERGDEVGLVVGEEVVPPERSTRRAARLLRPLAEVEPHRLDAPPPRRVTARLSRHHSVGGGA